MAVIGIDYTPAYEQGGGIGRYVRELTAALLAGEATDQAYRLFVAGAKNGTLPPVPRHVTWAPTPLTAKWLARIWHRARVPLPVETFTGPLDVYHSTDFVLPPTHKTTRTVLTIHDLSFIKSPETASPRLRRYLSEVVPRSVRRADFVLADSAATRADVIAEYGVQPDRVQVLLSGVDGRFHPVTDAAALARVRAVYGIGAGPYVFAIGTVQPRKNYARLVAALAGLRARGTDLMLVIAGGRGWLEDGIYAAIEAHRMGDRVRFIGYAEDTDLPALYSGAVCTAFVSLYEGFGLPVLESMACGTPVITSDVSSLPEVAGDAAPMVCPTDTGAIAAAIERVVTDEGHHADLRARGLAQVKRFSWEAAARQLQATYRMLAEEVGG